MNERITWRCPNCGLVLQVPAGNTVNCRCRARSTSAGELLTPGLPAWSLWGDRVADLADWLGFRKCPGCRGRQIALNRIGAGVYDLLTTPRQGGCGPAPTDRPRGD